VPTLFTIGLLALFFLVMALVGMVYGNAMAKARDTIRDRAERLAAQYSSLVHFSSGGKVGGLPPIDRAHRAVAEKFADIGEAAATRARSNLKRDPLNGFTPIELAVLRAFNDETGNFLSRIAAELGQKEKSVRTIVHFLHHRGLLGLKLTNKGNGYYISDAGKRALSYRADDPRRSLEASFQNVASASAQRQPLTANA
jgi:hypothetical protein